MNPEELITKSSDKDSRKKENCRPVPGPHLRRVVGRDGDEGRELVGMEQSSVCTV